MKVINYKINSLETGTFSLIFRIYQSQTINIDLEVREKLELKEM